MSENNKNEFIAIGWAGLLAIFASGFMLAEGIEDFSAGHPSAGSFFLAIVFVLLARSDAKLWIQPGRYVRRFLTWQRDSA